MAAAQLVQPPAVARPRRRATLAPEMAEARAALRHLVRAVNANLTSQTGNTVWRQAVFEEFRRHAGETDATRAARLTQEAHDVAFHLNSVREHKVCGCSHRLVARMVLPVGECLWVQKRAKRAAASASCGGCICRSRCGVHMHDHEPMCWRFLQELLFSHNIGVDRQKRQRQKLTDSARSVGLTLPDFSQ